VELAAGAGVECLFQAAADRETQGGGGLVGECGGVAGRVELGGDAAAREDLMYQLTCPERASVRA
jgi:hypothetical protein